MIPTDSDKFRAFLDWLISQAVKQLGLLGVKRLTSWVPADESLGTCEAKVVIEFGFKETEVDLSEVQAFEFYRLLNPDEVVRVGDEILEVQGYGFRGSLNDCVCWIEPCPEYVGNDAGKFLAVRRKNTMTKMHMQFKTGEIKANKNVGEVQG